MGLVQGDVVQRLKDLGLVHLQQLVQVGRGYQRLVVDASQQPRGLAAQAAPATAQHGRLDPHLPTPEKHVRLGVVGEDRARDHTRGRPADNPWFHIGPDWAILYLESKASAQPARGEEEVTAHGLVNGCLKLESCL